MAAPHPRTFDLEGWLGQRRREIDELLDRQLPQPADDPGRLVEAMRYSLLAPGKRLRPALGLAAAHAAGADWTPAIRLATAAVELVHCYSLIHDDLPAMDDDDERRGRPTSHKVFGEAVAILAGDALLTLAFEWLAEAGRLAATEAADEAAANARARQMLEASAALARAAGAAGMVRGQARDIHGDAQGARPATIAALETLHGEKTAALFVAALDIGALAAGAPPPLRQALRAFGLHYGIAFQHADDRDDAEHAALAAEAGGRLRHHLQAALDALAAHDPTRTAPLRALAGALGRTAGVTIDPGDGRDAA